MTKGTVHWENIRTGRKGHGQPIDIDAADAAAKEANKGHKNIHHWVVA